jgi:tRNA pseudouridine55 synthase
MNGVLVVDKPAGMTSADVVAQAKKRLGGPKIGHTGTLDPMATGVLPLVLGDGTKIAAFLLADDKEYTGELTLGLVTDTLDIQGKVMETHPVPEVLEDRVIADAVAAWVGEKQQVPPMYSALRVDGERLYDLARQGRVVDVAPRAIRVDRFDVLSREGDKIRFHVSCSKGTYVRSLVRDVGTALGCGATLSALRRTRSGAFTLDHAVGLADVASAGLISLADALMHLPAVSLTHAEAMAVAQGKPRPAPEGHPPGTLFRLLTPEGQLAAVATSDPPRLRYERVLVTPGKSP